MPNFDVLPASGTTCPPWLDERTNWRDFWLPRYRRIQAPTAPAVTTVVLHGFVDGVEAPMDVDIGDPFIASVVSFSGFPPSIVHTPGQSSVITLKFAASMIGHHEICVRRDGGGALILQLDVES